MLTPGGQTGSDINIAQVVLVVDTSVDSDDGMGIVMMMDGDAAILIKSHIVPQTEIIFNRNTFEHLVPQTSDLYICQVLLADNFCIFGS